MKDFVEQRVGAKLCSKCNTVSGRRQMLLHARETLSAYLSHSRVADYIKLPRKAE